ncbi:MAG: SBBP repeat-containing protein [Salibacteraceae bacterium]
MYLKNVCCGGNRSVLQNLCGWGISLTLLTSNVVQSQTPYIPPDYFNEDYSGDYVFIANHGQLRDTDKNPVPQVQYYSQSNYPLLFFQDDRMSFVQLEPPETTQGNYQYLRVDMLFDCQPENGCGSQLIATDQAAYHYNYFLPHTGNQGITNVANHKRLVYEGAYPNIDFHLSSNAMGPKMAVVVHENANPNLIHLKFEGQDKLENTVDGIKIFLEAWELVLPHAIAYEVDQNQQMTLLPWVATFMHNGSGDVTVNTGAYDASKKLVLLIGAPETAGRSGGPQNCWSTYIGGFGDFDEVNDMKVDGNENLYITGSAGSPDFPTVVGAGISSFNAFTDGYVSKFNNDGRLLFTTFIGGNLDDNCRSIFIDASEHIFFTLEASSHNIPMNCNNASGEYCQSYSHPPNSGFVEPYIGKLNSTGDVFLYGSYLGGSGEDRVPKGGIYVDPADNWTIVGYTDSPDFPVQNLTGAYNQSTITRKSGFIFQLDQSFTNTWSTFFSSSRDDEITALAGKPTGEILIGGLTTANEAGDMSCAPATNGGLPLCDPLSGAAYFQDEPARMFIAEFSDSKTMVWSSFFGEPGSLLASLRDVEYDSQGNILVLGSVNTNSTQSTCNAPTLGSGFPLCTRSGAYNSNVPKGSNDIFLGRFSSTYAYDWGFLWGGSQSDDANRIAVDANENIYLTGATSSNDFPLKYKWDFYYQHGFADGNSTSRSDPIIMGFDADGQDRWATYYGGPFTSNQSNPNFRLSEYSNSVTVGPNGSIYMGGITTSSGFPYQCNLAIQYCRSSPQGNSNDLDEGFIVRFDVSQILHLKEHYDGATPFSIAPNPATDYLILNWEQLNTSGYRVQVVTASGQEVLELNVAETTPQAFIPLPDMVKGLYIVNVYAEGAIFSCKFIHQ